MASIKRRLKAMHRKEPPELDITAFLNLMVALIPFLLITAVFSRITILQLNLPAAGGAEQIEEKKVTLEVIVRRDRIEIGDGLQIVARIPNVTEPQEQSGEGEDVRQNAGSRYDLKKLSAVLREIKGNYPGKQDATVLMEPDLEYELLVKIMDTVSTVEVPDESGNIQKYELFPQISVGDAPGAETSARLIFDGEWPA